MYTTVSNSCLLVLEKEFILIWFLLPSTIQDPDASIRKRALELVSLLVNENNVKQLTKELIDYLEISDEDFKEDLSAKICSIVEK